jgi:hypothetical protein
MLRKTSVSMMVLLVVAASLIGISSIHQYIEGQAPKPQQAQQKVQVEGQVHFAVIDYPSKTCTAIVELPGENLLRLKPGTTITLVAPSESFCTLFGLSKIGNTPIQFVTQTAPSSTERVFRVTHVIL